MGAKIVIIVNYIAYNVKIIITLIWVLVNLFQIIVYRLILEVIVIYAKQLSPIGHLCFQETQITMMMLIRLIQQ